MSALQMIPFAGWADTGWTEIAVRSRLQGDAKWHEVDDAPISLEAAMAGAAAKRWIVAQRHEEKVSHLVGRPSRAGRA